MLQLIITGKIFKIFLSKQLFLTFFILAYIKFLVVNIVQTAILKLSIGTIIKNPEIIRFIPDHLKTKKVFKHTVKKIPFVIRYVSDLSKTQRMYDKAIIKYGGTSKFILDNYKDKKCVINPLMIM